jgi:hypothetical protein
LAFLGERDDDGPLLGSQAPRCISLSQRVGGWVRVEQGQPTFKFRLPIGHQGPRLLYFDRELVQILLRAVRQQLDFQFQVGQGLLAPLPLPAVHADAVESQFRHSALSILQNAAMAYLFHVEQGDERLAVTQAQGQVAGSAEGPFLGRKRSSQFHLMFGAAMDGALRPAEPFESSQAAIALLAQPVGIARGPESPARCIQVVVVDFRDRCPAQAKSGQGGLF